MPSQTKDPLIVQVAILWKKWLHKCFISFGAFFSLKMNSIPIIGLVANSKEGTLIVFLKGLRGTLEIFRQQMASKIQLLIPHAGYIHMLAVSKHFPKEAEVIS